MLLAVELIPQLLPKWLTGRGTAMEINFETYCCNCKFLASRGLVLREKNEIFGSPHNGNFLGALKLLAEFDD